MDEQRAGLQSIDAYIAAYPTEIQARLQALRATIRAAAPEAEEAKALRAGCANSYQMPTFCLHGNLVHFAAHKGHIGFHPTPSGIAAFQERLACYKGSKGAVQFPFDEPLPLSLVAEIVRFRVAENVAAAEAKALQRQVSRARRGGQGEA